MSDEQTISFRELGNGLQLLRTIGNLKFRAKLSCNSTFKTSKYTVNIPAQLNLRLRRMKKSVTYWRYLMITGFIFSISVKASQVDDKAPTFFSSLNNSTQAVFQRCGIDNEELNRLLTLSYDDFDQNFDGGWRTLSFKDNCKPAAQKIIELYILFDNAINSNQLKLLRWHAGQLAADLGNYPLAIAFFNASIDNDGESAKSKKPWNLYAKGSIAFLMRDKNALQQIRDELSVIPVSEDEKNARRQFLKENPNIQMPDGFIDKPQNLSVLDRLLRCFEQPYSAAYNVDEC